MLSKEQEVACCSCTEEIAVNGTRTVHSVSVSLQSTTFTDKARPSVDGISHLESNSAKDNDNLLPTKAEQETQRSEPEIQPTEDDSTDATVNHEPSVDGVSHLESNSAKDNDDLLPTNAEQETQISEPEIQPTEDDSTDATVNHEPSVDGVSHLESNSAKDNDDLLPTNAEQETQTSEPEIQEDNSANATVNHDFPNHDSAYQQV